MVQDYNEKHTENQKFGVGFDYSRRPGKGTINDYVDDVTVKPHILKKVYKQLFKVTEVKFDEEALVIK